MRPVAPPPSAIARLDDGTLRSLDLDVFRRYRDLGFTPVTFGDVVLDARRWFAICSGDLLMLALAEAFHPESAIFVADVDGVYTADPKRVKPAKFLPTVGRGTLGAIDTNAEQDDGTGGLRGKLGRMGAMRGCVDDAPRAQARRAARDQFDDRRVWRGEGDQREPREGGRGGGGRDGGRVAARRPREVGARGDVRDRPGLRRPSAVREPRCPAA